MSTFRILYCCPTEIHSLRAPGEVEPLVQLERGRKKKKKKADKGIVAKTFKWDVLMCMPPSGSTESKVVPPGSLTHGPSMDGKGSENWQSPKTPKSHYTRVYKGGIILSFSFKWPAVAVTHSHVPQTNHNVLRLFDGAMVKEKQ